MTFARWDPDLPPDSSRRSLLEHYERLVDELNRRVNLFARGAMGASFYERHILHALCLRWRGFEEGSTVVDWGAGGGIPGIPLAICCPAASFVLVEANGKKAAALGLIRSELRLSNVEVWNGRAEAWDGSHTYAVSRATASLVLLWEWTRRGLDSGAGSGSGSGSLWGPGLICLKGGELADEVDTLRRSDPRTVVKEIDLAALTGRSAFRDKYVVHVAPAG